MERRRLRVVKYRGSAFRGGYYDYLIRQGGLEVFPRLVAAEHRRVAKAAKLPSDIPELDQLMGGGIEEGTSTLIIGGAGTGKSTIAAQICAAAAGRGQKSIMFVFDESPSTLFTRCTGLGVAIEQHNESGLIRIVQVDPAELSPAAARRPRRLELVHRLGRLAVSGGPGEHSRLAPARRHVHGRPLRALVLARVHDRVAARLVAIRHPGAQPGARLEPRGARRTG